MKIVWPDCINNITPEITSRYCGSYKKIGMEDTDMKEVKFLQDEEFSEWQLIELNAVS